MAATTTIVASGASYTVKAAYEKVREFWANAQATDVGEFELADGGRAMLAASTFQAVSEQVETQRNAIGFR